MLTFETDFSVQNNLFVYVCLEFTMSFLVEKQVLNVDIYAFRYNTNIFYLVNVSIHRNFIKIISSMNVIHCKNSLGMNPNYLSLLRSSPCRLDLDSGIKTKTSN